MVQGVLANLHITESHTGWRERLVDAEVEQTGANSWRFVGIVKDTDTTTTDEPDKDAAATPPASTTMAAAITAVTPMPETGNGSAKPRLEAMLGKEFVEKIGPAMVSFANMVEAVPPPIDFDTEAVEVAGEVERQFLTGLAAAPNATAKDHLAIADLLAKASEKEELTVEA